MKSTRFANSASAPQTQTSPRAVLQAAWVVLGLAVVLRSAGLWDFESAITQLPPLCFFHALTDIDCPGCGMTHAFLCLARGDVAGAWAFHPFSPLLAALLLALAWGPKKIWSWLQHSTVAQNASIAALTLVLAWWGWTKLLPLV
jgi:Protein of unknown function (DUF2752)